MMRLALFGIALLLTACAAPLQEKMTTPTGGGPAWLPAYSAEQLALLAPSHQHVIDPATRTYPEVSRFRYARDRLLEDPRDAMRVTKIVADVIAESAHVYTVATAGPELANIAAQYGPKAATDPDAWSIAFSDRSGNKYLVSAKLSERAKNAHALGRALAQRGESRRAIEKFSEALQASPNVPALHLALGEAFQASGDPERAEAAYREVLRVDATVASGHRALASILIEKGDISAARTSLAHALSYHPDQPEALALAERIAGQSQRIQAFAIFLEVDAVGVVRVAAAPTAGARMYAGCRAVMRYEPELRSALFAEPPGEPYFLSAAEEMFCVESAIGAYVAERAVARDEGRAEAKDSETEALMTLAHTEGLLGFVMFEILGRHRPEHARLAPQLVHRATMNYVKRHVLGYDPGPDLSSNVATLR